MPLGFSFDDLPDPEIERWNKFPWALSNNCYSYALNSPLTYHEFKRGAGNSGWNTSCDVGRDVENPDFPEKLKEAFKKKGLIYIGRQLLPISDCYPIATWTWKEKAMLDGKETEIYAFHIMRLNKTGYWSDHFMQGPAVEYKNLWIWEYEPRNLATPRYNFLGFWGVPRRGLPIIEGRTIEALDRPYRTRSKFVREAKKECFSRTGQITVTRNDYRALLGKIKENTLGY